jgi:hypothetical protein
MVQRKSRLALVSICVLGVSLLAAEAFARYYLGLGTPPLFIAHPTIEYMYKPNQGVRRFGNRFIVNAYGMRSEPFEPHKQAGELRVMVFGDSVLNGGTLTDHKDLATTVLAKTLAQRTGRQVTVGHISTGSWGPGNWLAYAREYGFFDADIIALVVSSHDYGDNPTFAKLNEATHPTHAPPAALIEGVTRYLPRYLPSTAPKVTDIDTGGYAPVPTREAVTHALGDLKTFLELAQRQSRRVIVFQHFEKRELYFAATPEGHARIKQLCDELGIGTVDLARAFRGALQRGLSPYRDNIHPTQLGQQLLADSMLAAFADFR